VRKNEAGFTTVELIVTIQIAFLLAGFVYAVFYFSSRFFGEWREKSELENAAFLCARSLQHDVLHTSNIVAAGDRVLRLRTISDRLVTYELESQRLMREHRPLLSSDVRVDSLVFRYAKHDTSAGTTRRAAPGLKYFIPTNEPEIAQISLIEYEIVLVKGKQRMSMKSSAMPRNTAGNVFDLL
jgi:hypothetical protein